MLRLYTLERNSRGYIDGTTPKGGRCYDRLESNLKRYNRSGIARRRAIRAARKALAKNH